jgi:4-amino-4-deoxy-L-arabinose transferase-like glycosyltransferase
VATSRHVILSEAKDLQLSRATKITLVAGLVRLLVASFTPLFPDEMYYWDWTRHLATGYFDHPPMLAWLIWIGAKIGGATPFGVRLMPVVVGTLGAWVLTLAARRLGDEKAALWTSVLFAVMPLSAAGLILATPDAPLLATAALTMYAVIRALENPPRSRESLIWWSVAGAAIGLAFTSKYTAILLPVGVFVALVARHELRARLAEPGPYVATIIATAVFSPVISWNARHEWASFAFQLGHGFGAVGGSILNRELELLGGQAGLVTPILFVMMLIAAWKEVRSPSAESREPRTILPFVFAFVLVFFAYSAMKRRVEANWPALAYIPATLVLATHAGGRTWDRWMKSGIALAGIVSLVTYIDAFTPILPVPAPRDPNARAAGWTDFARSVDSLYQPTRSLSSRRTWLAGNRYQETAALAFHIPTHPVTFSLNIGSRTNQYALWPTFAQTAQPNDDLILVVDDLGAGVKHDAVAQLQPHFAFVAEGPPIQLRRNGELVKALRVWRLNRWKGTWLRE